jgi:hypothetical protein
MTMNKNAFWKLVMSTVGVTTAALTIMASSPEAAFAGEDGSGDGGCAGGSQLCRTTTRCIGVPPYTHCETVYEYQQPAPPPPPGGE